MKKYRYSCPICQKEIKFKDTHCSKRCVWIDAHRYTGETLKEFTKRRLAKGLKVVPNKI